MSNDLTMTYHCPDCDCEIDVHGGHVCNGIDLLQTEMLRLEATAYRIQQIYNALPDEIKASLKFRIEFDEEERP